MSTARAESIGVSRLNGRPYMPLRLRDSNAVSSTIGSGSGTALGGNLGSISRRPFDRREILRIGGVSILSAATLQSSSTAAASDTQAGDASTAATSSKTGGSCIFILLQGGPSHIDLWDPKPDAPEQVRGPFKSIETVVPGIRVGEVMPLTAAQAHNIAFVRSMTHPFSNHIAGTYVTLTAAYNQPDADREAHSDDFPGPGAILNYLHPEPAIVPRSIAIPNWLSIPGPSNRMPGQYGGLIGAVHDPVLIAGDPNRGDFKPLDLALPNDISSGRLAARSSLQKSLDQSAEYLESTATRSRLRFHDAAYRLLQDAGFRAAVDLSQESATVRDRYGRSKLGQSLLLARRLIEAGVKFVACNEFNQHWDHHGDIGNTLRHHGPVLDRAYAALIGDLEERGLLDSTLVINTGEFGRTPQINAAAGRDHWPFVYTTLLAGGKIRGGQAYGSSDAKGAYVAAKPVSPADILATMWTSMGIDPHTEIRDRLGRPYLVCQGRVPDGLLDDSV